MKSIQFFLFLLMGYIQFAPPIAAQDSQNRQRIQLTLARTGQNLRTIHVKQDLWWNPTDSKNTASLEFYGQRYAKKLPYLNDLSIPLLYPNTISLGKLSMRSCTFAEQLCHVDFNGQKALVWVEGFKSEGDWLKLEYSYEVPEKYGSFGYFDNELTLSDGWYFRFDALSAVHTHLQIFSDQYVLVNDQKILEPQSDLNELEFNDIGILIKTFAEPPSNTCGGTENLHVCLVHENRILRRDIKVFQLIFDDVSSFVQNQPELKNLTKSIRLVQAPLREVLVRNSPKASLVSDRAFRVSDFLVKFEQPPVVQALFFQILENKTFSPAFSNHFLEREALAWYWTEQYFKFKKQQEHDARKMKAIRLLSFLPVVDILLYSPQFPFSDVFFDSVFPYDPNRDDFWRYNEKAVSGRTLYERLKDILGQDRDLVFARATENDYSISEAYEKWRLGRSEAPEYNYLLNYPGRNDYVLNTKASASGKSLNVHARVKERADSRPVAEADANNGERVEIWAFRKNEAPSKWSWYPNKGPFEKSIDDAKNISAVEIDPRFRSLDVDRSNNRTPPKYKFVLSELFANYDVANAQPQVFMSGVFRRVYGGANRYTMRASYFGDSYGFGLGMYRLFGTSVDSLRLSHAVSISAGLDKLKEDLVTLQTSTGLQNILVSPDGFSSSISLGYGFGNFLSFTNPLSGYAFSTYFTYATSKLGGDFNYIKGGASAEKVWMLTPKHLLAARVTLSTTRGDTIPSAASNQLGGTFAMRGLSYLDDRYRGSHEYIASAEYRHMLVQNMDVDFGLFRWRALQGALFSDVGAVTETVQELAESKVTGLPVSGFLDLFDAQYLQVDGGYGLRLFVDYFGVYTQLLGFDVATDLRHGSLAPKFYFRVTQSF